MSKRLKQTPERIFIDATYTLCSGRSSGIERVVRNLLAETQSMGAAGDIPMPVLVVSHGGAFYEVTDTFLRGLEKTTAMQANVLSTMPVLYQNSTKLLCETIPSRTLTKWLRPQAGHLGVFKVWHNFRSSQILRRLASVRSPIQPRANDLFILPDAYWVNRLQYTVWPAARHARQAGAKVASVIYDLIPLTHPKFVGVKRQENFKLYLDHALRNSDMLLAISRTVLKQLADYIGGDAGAKHDAQQLPRLSAFSLGAEIKPSAGSVRKTLVEMFGRQRTPYLMVATIDPRKNHAYVLDAFDQLWQSGDESELCLVGRIGSRCDELLRRFMEHPQLGRKLHLFEDLADCELHHCYQGCRGVIFPSIVEGFGLPIVEALWYGKKTFVSDTDIHREVGQGDCCYFDLQMPESLVECVRAWERTIIANPGFRLPVRRPVSWSESSEQFLENCFELFAEASHRSPAAVGHCLPC